MAMTEHATNEQMATIMGWERRKNWYINGQEKAQRRVDDWYPTDDLNHAALVEARLAELGLQMSYVVDLLSHYPGETIEMEPPVVIAPNFVDFHFWQITADAQTRCDAAWTTWQAWKEQGK